MANPRVVIVGAGPAGIRCAEMLVEHGVHPVLVNEGSRDGGQIYRRQPAHFRRSYEALYGAEAQNAKAVHQCFDALQSSVDYRPDTTVWNLADGELHCASDGRHSSIAFDHLVLCTGATDRLMPVKGWQLAGCYSLGGAQIALKAQAVSIGRAVVFMGTGPLLYLVASQYVKAGAQVAAVLDTSPFFNRVKAMPKLLARPALVANGMGLLATLYAARVPLHFGVELNEVQGDPISGVGAVRFKTANGAVQTITCDAVAMGYHLRPETQLADLVGCAFTFDTVQGQWVLALDADGRTSVPGVYAAGDGARVRGADGAQRAGRIAALAVLEDLRKPYDPALRTQLLGELVQMDRFREGLAQAFPWPAQRLEPLPDDAIVCRCEMISAGELRDAVRAKGACEVNRAKAFSRVGMGRCQGRYCSQAGAQIIADAAGIDVIEVGRQRGQAPVKPLTMNLIRSSQ